MRDHETSDIEIRLFLEAIFLKYRSDFRRYTISSIRRRLGLALNYFHLESISQLQDKILGDSSAYDRVLQYLTVPTSEMFRDPSFYRALREQVVPILRTYPSLKIWIAGCSTGEELYSYAILLREEGLLDRTIIYATDIAHASLKKAEAGIFHLDHVKSFTQNYQKAGGRGAFNDYYQVAFDSAVFDPSLRKNVVFADHSLATDSVFAEVHLVSCRNVLIYFDRELQSRAFRLFHDSLVNRGFVGLGAKETMSLDPIRGQFDEFAPKEKIYRKVGIGA